LVALGTTFPWRWVEIASAEKIPRVPIPSLSATADLLRMLVQEDSTARPIRVSGDTEG